MTERHQQILSELSDLGLALARDLQARAVAAADDKAAGEMALAFHRVSRSLRQTLALEARLQRESRQDLREAAQDAARETLARVQQRRRQVRNAVCPLIWNEAEGEEAEALLEALEFRLMAQSEEEGFLEAPLEACIARIREELGLAASAAGGGAAGAAPSVVIWRSSA